MTRIIRMMKPKLIVKPISASSSFLNIKIVLVIPVGDFSIIGSFYVMRFIHVLKRIIS